MAQLDPNIILQAGKFDHIDPAQTLDAGNKIALGRLAVARGRQTQDALDRVRSDPTNMQALGDLAALDPQAANGYMAVQSAQRAGQARMARADLARSLAPDSGATPAPAPAVSAAGPTLSLPATGQTVQLPADPSAAPAAPPAGGAPDPFDHKGPATQIVGAQITSGKLTPQEAAAHLLEVSDPEDLAKTAAALKGLDDQQFDRVTRLNKSMADTLASIKASVPDDPTHAARHAAFMQNAPQLAQLGITPQQLAQVDLSDAGINGVVGKAAGFQGLLDQANKDRSYALDVRKEDRGDRAETREEAAQAETQRHNMADEAKPVTAGFGSTLVDPRTGRVVYDNTGGAAGGVGAADGKTTGGWTPRARNGGDNSDAAVDGKIAGAAKFLGVDPTADISKLSPMQIAKAMTLSEGGAGSIADKNNNPANLRNSDGSYKRFPTKDAGLQAAAALVARKLAAGQTSVQTMIEGLPVGGSAGGARAAGGLSAQAVDLAARQGLANGGTVPAGYSRNRAAQAAITNRMAELAQGKDVTSIIQGGQDVKSQANAYKTFNSNKAGTGGFQVRTFNVANAHLDQLAETASALGAGNTPLLNRLSQAYAGATGQAAPTNFNTIKQYVSVEVLKAIEGGVGGVGDRAAAEHVLNAAQSPQQLAGAVKQIQGLMVGQLAGVQQSYETSTGRKDFERYLSPRSQQMLAQHQSGGARAGGPPPGAIKTATGPGGKKLALVGGQWVPY